jgi:hypothetical protein
MWYNIIKERERKVKNMIEFVYNHFYLDTYTNKVLLFEGSCEDNYFFSDDDGESIVLGEDELSHLIEY